MMLGGNNIENDDKSTMNFRIDYKLPVWITEEQKEAVSKIIENAAKECVSLLGASEDTLRKNP